MSKVLVEPVTQPLPPATWQRPSFALPSSRLLPLAYLVLGVIGFIASFSLAVDSWRAAADPDHVMFCAIDETLDCAPALELWQASVFGFPNPYLGIAAFSVVTTLAVCWLAVGRPPRWFRIALLVATALGQLLVFFLMYTTFTLLNALCPWCTVVWIIMWPLLWLQIVDLLPEVAPAGRLAALVVPNRWLFLALGYLLAVIVGLATMGLRVLR